MRSLASDPLSAQIDLRAHWPSIRDQGDRGSCLACSASDAHNFARPLPHLLSAEYLFYSASLYMAQFDVQQGLTFFAAQSALESDGQPHDAEWPLLTQQPMTWAPPEITTLWHAKLVLGLSDHTSIVDRIKASMPVILVIRLTADFLDENAGAEIIPANGAGFGSHAVLAVGYGADSTSEYVLIRNSWGSGWRSNGYAWLPLDYLNDKLVAHAAVTPI